MLTSDGATTTHGPFCFCEICRGEVEEANPEHAELVKRGYKIDTDLAGKVYYFCRKCGEEIDMSAVALPEAQRQSKKITSLPDKAQSTAFAPWIKPTNIKKKGQTKLVLTGVIRPVSSAFGEGIALEVTNGTKKKFDFNVKFNSGNYGRLFDKFGKNPSKWKGPIMVQVAQHMGKAYIQVA